MNRNRPYPASAAADVEEPLRYLDSRWKLLILFHCSTARMRRRPTWKRLIPPPLAEDAGAFCCASSRNDGAASARSFPTRKIQPKSKIPADGDVFFWDNRCASGAGRDPGVGRSAENGNCPLPTSTPPHTFLFFPFVIG